MFNATHGARRLLYHGPDDWHIDVFLDTFEMSHTLDLGAKLEAEPETLAAAELLLTKLQVAEVNHKDLSDTAMLLWDHEPAGNDGPGTINLSRIAATCAATGGSTPRSPTTSAPAPRCSPSLVTAAADRDRIGSPDRGRHRRAGTQRRSR